MECSRSFHFAPRRLACAPAPACTLLTTISPTSSTTRSIGRGAPFTRTCAASSTSSGISLVRAKSLPVPSGRMPEHGALEVVAPVERGHDGVQAAVAARDDDPPGAGAVQGAVELARVGRRLHLDRGVRAEDRQRLLQRLLVGRAGIAVGDHEERVHRWDHILCDHCQRSPSSEPSGVTRARARRPTSSAAGSTTSSSSTAATTPGTPWSSARERRSRSTPCTCCPAASSPPAAPPSSATASSSTWRCSSRRSRGSRRAAWTPRCSRSRANAHVIADYNRTLDKVTERFLGSRRLGTTGRGIGPTYADKMNRIGIRIQDLFDEKILQAKVEGVLELKNQILTKIYNRRSVDRRGDRRGAGVVRRPAGPDGLRHRAAAQPGARPRRDRAARGRPGHPARRRPRHLPVRDLLVGDGRRRLHRLGHPADPAGPGDRDRQGLHDPRGGGAVPDRAARRLRRAPAQGRPEYGTTTGRPRRCGWYDTVIARYAARVNGVTDFVLTKLDVLTGLEKVPVCVAYDVDGVRHDEMPVNQSDFHHAVPIYEELPGWWEDISGARIARGPARQRAGVRRARSRSCPVPGSRRSASARPATRPSSCTTCCSDVVLDWPGAEPRARPSTGCGRLRGTGRPSHPPRQGPVLHRHLHRHPRGDRVVPGRPPRRCAARGHGPLVERRAGRRGRTTSPTSAGWR